MASRLRQEQPDEPVADGTSPDASAAWDALRVDAMEGTPPADVSATLSEPPATSEPETEPTDKEKTEDETADKKDDTELFPEEVAKPNVGPVVTVDDFEDLYTRFQTPLINFIFRLVGNREQAYDLTQDVFTKAWRAMSGGTAVQAGAFSSWLYRIASNTATDALRRRRLINWLPLSLFNEDRGVGAGLPGLENADGSRQGSGDEAMPNASSAFAGGYDGGRFEQHVADREVIQAALKRLPPKYASCLLLYEHEGFSCAEIAEVLSLSPSAVKMRLMRARERFITLYKQEADRFKSDTAGNHVDPRQFEPARPHTALSRFENMPY